MAAPTVITPVPRAEAMALGLKHFIPEEPCKNGHTSKRRTKDGACLKCWSEYMREWAERNPTAREKARARMDAWKAKNHLRHRRNQTRWQSAQRTSAPPWLTEEHRRQMDDFYWLAQDCSMVSGAKYHVDHIVPLQGENVCGLHVPWNLQVLPGDIDRSKGNRLVGITETEQG